jgi:hypothetical protein
MAQSASKASIAEAKTQVHPENQGHDTKHSPKPPHCNEHWEKDTRGVASISQRVPYGTAKEVIRRDMRVAQNRPQIHLGCRTYSAFQELQ